MDLKQYNKYFVFTILKNFEKNVLGYNFKSKSLLIEALTKDPPTNCVIKNTKQNPIIRGNYERLEFLGDSIIEIYVLANVYHLM